MPVEISLNAGGGLCEDPDDSDTITSYTWQYDDVNTSAGPVSIPGNTTTPTHIFNEPGEYEISLNVTDDEGTTSTTPATRTLYVLPDEVLSPPRAVGVPRDPDKSPVVDGVLSGTGGSANVYGENGWTGAAMLSYGQGTDEDVVFNGIRHNSDNTILFFSFDVYTDTAFNANDVIYFGVRGNLTDPWLTDVNDRLIKFTPSTNIVEMYEKANAASPWIAMDTGVPSNVFTTRQSSFVSNHWAFEIAVPRTADPANDWPGLDQTFLFYFDFFRSDPVASTVYHYHFPQSVDQLAGQSTTFDLDTYQFNPLWWGIADITGTYPANGLSIEWADIGAGIPT